MNMVMRYDEKKEHVRSVSRIFFAFHIPSASVDTPGRVIHGLIGIVGKVRKRRCFIREVSLMYPKIKK